MQPKGIRQLLFGRALRVIIGGSLLLAGCGGPPTSPPLPTLPQAVVENWPAYAPDPAWKPLVADALARYLALGYTYKTNLQDYSPSGDYLNFSLTDFWRNIPGVEQLDANGVPMINYGGTFFYNPVTTAEFSLSEHGKWLRGFEPDPSKFWAGINKLLELQKPDGSFPYPFDFSYYLNDKFFHAGWTSALAQGMALSAFARAYQLTGDSKYLDAGDRAFVFLSKTVSDGGDTQNLRFLDASLSDALIPDEYPAEPSAYTLNGAMFTLLGVYDWWQTEDAGMSQIAGRYFRRSIRTLGQLLPYYDVGGFSAYDLGHVIYKHLPTLAPDYHEFHIYLLHALESITGDPVIAKYENLWRSYVPQ